jgi:hypothetical protein
MRAVTTAEKGVVSAETVVEFAQEGSVVWARYAGGEIRLGYLVGVISDDSLRFRFIQLDNSGRLDGGHSDCEIVRPDGGRMRLIEHFNWDSREGSGTNVFEEIEVTRS